ncbi:phage tail protein [Desulfovibrio ferrophilus]|uniref:Putative phage tail fiber-related protein n=1 Tax=Desulfovibrio ferrophilus TaxID=241368 RepID=A0A2Z6B2C1_9BACT|nr:phage tail protein [Desulfovibrio ferrophilus]BBD09603.1 putative phage tail fiber-related protein [Desulfovibrio ferrophilus]
MATKRLCPAADGDSALGKDTKRWGDIQTHALNGQNIALDGAAAHDLPGLVLLATEAQAQDPAIDTKAVTPMGLMAAISGKLDTTAKASTIQAEAGMDDETWMTPALTSAAIAALTETPPSIPAGTVVAMASSTRPDGWLECNGASLSTSTYADLYAVIGTTFGSGTGTFKLPDLRGEFLRGWDHNRGVDSGRTVGSTQAQAYKSHTHAASIPNAISEGSGRGLIYMTSSGATSITSGSSGGSETRPRNIALIYLIKY